MRMLNDKELNPALIKRASQLLRETLSAPMGSEQPFDLEGKRYVARVEWHENAAKGKHRGITLYVPDEVAAPSPTPAIDSILAVPGIEHTTPEFRAAIVAMAGRLQCNPDDIATVMSLETGATFSPSVRNPQSSATGLIQFMSSIAKAMGTTTAELAAMTDLEQLVYVERYFAPFTGRLKTLDSTYLAVFMPVMMGRLGSTVVFYKGQKGYEQNIGFDKARKGSITVDDITTTIRGVAAKAKGRRFPVAQIQTQLPPPTALERETIGLGSQGPAVEEWQRIIGVKVDGVFGPETRRASVAWQTAHGLKGDGLIGPKSWAVALAKPPGGAAA